MVVRMRHTRGHTRNRRSHHGIEGQALSKCASCGASHVRHRACAACGTYRGRQVFSVAKKHAKTEKKKKEKAEAGKAQN
ncbi:MAG: 50S ribosomal protein L32 [Candidatus Lloydbacteria bacterium RIFCSPHIGHO2_02_FULL_51_22]|uniref:Large ribosomal subunit protein bL32 n=1 Tax=Candidatus Lloydbacteria bacterium RIFCSPHIGHO2_02_FULL_51_22 TaxID=1798663 RepID=A0A1G2DG08_9BACT|nr:MAG: 50S ribosomal protein L32 [Candidatus Lloydbacteria bacterium RIFCSPHIGHO2_02_FULL_51_22]